MRKKDALCLLDCSNQELAKMLNITPSYLSRFDELNEFYESVVYGRLAIIEGNKYKDIADNLSYKCDQLKDQIKRITKALDS